MKLLSAAAMLAFAVPAVAAPAAKGAAAPAASRPAANRDVRCLLLANMYRKVAAAAQGRETAEQARLFYYGRISGRLSGAALTSAMEAAAKTIDPAKAGADMSGCVATVQSTATAVDAAGDKVRAAVVTPAAVAAPAVGPAKPAGN